MADSVKNNQGLKEKELDTPTFSLASQVQPHHLSWAPGSSTLADVGRWQPSTSPSSNRCDSGTHTDEGQLAMMYGSMKRSR